MNEAAEIKTAVIVVDHGSRRAASNEMLEQATRNFAAASEYQIIEPAHMELAQPDICAAFRRCVERGAQRVIVFPYFLSPGRHWSEDIPNLTRAAAAEFPDIEWIVTAPFGLHPDMSEIIADRIQHCLKVARQGAGSCDACSAENPCQLQRSNAKCE